jgi:hypothetical protein
MKRLLLIIVLSIIGTALYAQTPQAINYQGVARDNSGNVLINQNVSLRLSILSGSASGPVVYAETHSKTTDGFGLFALKIGQGSVASGTFSTISWGTDTYYLKVEIDPVGGTAYQLVGTNQFVSVPYALYAESSGSINAWNLNGNAGINDTTDFIGTTDNVPLNFKVNNQLSGRIDPVLNNNFYGYQCGISNTTGFYNSASGFQSLYSNSSGNENTAAGWMSLYLNTTGYDNTATGLQSLYNNSTGYYNTGSGFCSLFSNTTGDRNTATGGKALMFSTTGIRNTADGYAALYSNIEGNYNAALGEYSLMQNLGSYNTALGTQTGFNNIDGSGNVFIGYRAGYNDTGSNKLYIANNETTPLIYGDFSTGRIGLGTINPTAKFQIETQGINNELIMGMSGLLFQNQTPDSRTIIALAPNGTEQDADFIIYHNSDLNTNFEVLDLGYDNDQQHFHIGTMKVGTGIQRPLVLDATGRASNFWNQLSLATNGNVGMGTTSPATKLDVYGIITSVGGNSTNWNTAFGWGNHAGLYRPAGWVPDWEDITSKPTYAAVAISGSYNDLNNKPTGHVPGDMQYWNGTEWVTVGVGQPGQFLQLNASGIPAWSGSMFATITTTGASSISFTTATSGGNISSDGGEVITARGVCWSMSSNPTITDSKTSDGTGTGTFTSSITGLNYGTTYYVRAYATNIVGTTYGNQLSFTTLVSIGDNYQGGKVAYILQAGDPGYNADIQHGLIAAPSDQSTGIQWYNGSYTVTGATGTAIGTGNSNTNIIVANQGEGNYAAKLCYDLVLDGYSDWYFPSSDELFKLYLNRIAIGGFTIGGYWSSSEYDLTWTHFLDFNNGGPNIFHKDNNAVYVRAIRSF